MKDIVYTLSLYVTRNVDAQTFDSTPEQTAEWMISAEAKRELEREVLQALRKLDGDCDIEVMSVEEK